MAKRKKNEPRYVIELGLTAYVSEPSPELNFYVNGVYAGDEIAVLNKLEHLYAGLQAAVTYMNHTHMCPERGVDVYTKDACTCGFGEFMELLIKEG